MTKPGVNIFRIETNYAAVQGSYWSSACVLNGFTAVYLSFKGLTNTQIGLTSSLLSVIAIFLQIIISNFADAHANVQLKKIVSVFYIVAVTCCAIVWLLPIPIAMIIIVYSIAAASQGTISGLISALMMQFSNIGLRVNYGWPRGIGSICYALSAYIIGIVLENYAPDILMPIYIALTILAIISVSIMPNPHKIKHEYHLPSMPEKGTERLTSYREMIRSNPTLVLFLGASVVLFIGQSPIMVFLIRLIESLGGSNKELGISMLIQSSIELPMMFASVWVLNKFKIHHILVFCFFCYFIKGLALSLAPSITSVYGIMAISLFCMGIYGFASVIFVNSIVKSTERVRAQSLVILSLGLGLIIGSYFSGSVIDSVGLKYLLMICWIILIAAALLMLACHRTYARQFLTRT
jgi:MFS transporter, PPP family, 3-phenylpropionic acid transporter